MDYLHVLVNIFPITKQFIYTLLRNLTNFFVYLSSTLSFDCKFTLRVFSIVFTDSTRCLKKYHFITFQELGNRLPNEIFLFACQVKDCETCLEATV